MKIIIKCTDGIMTGKEWRFNGSGQITLGREKGSMVTTAPEDNSISRHQCVIDVVPPNVYVSDAGSTHGTYVNGQLIGKKGQGGQCPVRDGAFIGVGSGGRTAVFQIRMIEEERGTVSPDYIADNMDNHYNRSSNGQNLGNDFASSFQFVVPRIRDIFIRPVHTAIEFGKMNSAILGTTMILINMAVFFINDSFFASISPLVESINGQCNTTISDRPRRSSMDVCSIYSGLSICSTGS